jgi:kynurenine formamidase
MPTILQQLVAELDAGRLRVIDLTQPLGPDTPVIGLPPIFAPSPGVTIDVISKYDDKGPAWYWNTIRMGEHTGTHFDAPIHWITGKDLPNNACDTIEPRRFVGPACVIDITREVEQNADYLLTPQDLERWEKQNGRVPRNAWVLLRTGWSKRRTAKEFLNDRDVLGVGVETIGTDAGQAGRFDPPFPNHSTMHGAGKFGLASLCNLDQLPVTGAVVIAAPLKLVNGSGSPLRVLAIAP